VSVVKDQRVNSFQMMRKKKKRKDKFDTKDEPKTLPFLVSSRFSLFFFKEERQHIKFDSSRIFF
jgi:hypothetical protein